MELGNSRAVRSLGDLIKSYKPDNIFLSETIYLESRINDLCNKFGYRHHFMVDSIGRSGGLAVMWKQNVACVIAGYLSNFIDIHLMDQNSVSGRLTCF